MASRGGGHPSRGAGPPGGGRGNGNAGGRGWEGGHGGRGWNSGNNGGRGSNFVQGGPSGTAGSGSGGNSGHDTENHDNIFADGVFRAAPGRPNNGAGGYRNNQGFNRYNERRNFGGNGGNFWYNERRYTGYPNGRNVNPRQNDTADGLTVIQRQLVKEAAEALARQFVERQPDPVRSSDAPMQSAESQPMGPVAHAQPAVQMLQGRDYQLVLTSASLVRTGDAEGKIDETLGIEVFLPPKHSVEGILELYHENYNIALVRLKHDLTTAISPQDIFNVRESTENKSVVAIGRGPKRSHGLLMASMGEAKGKYKTEHKNKRSTGLAKKLYCPDLLISTCQIKKVGIGGPLIDLDGSFIGMNFYEESETTPFLPRKTIVTVLHKGFDLLERAAEPMDKVSGCGEESSSSSSAMESFVKNLQLKRKMVMERRSVEQRFRNELREKMMDAPFEPETFGDLDSTKKISDSILRRGVVSVALLSEDVLVYACSGISVSHTHANIQAHQSVFVTSARLAQKFNDNRTRDDNLRIEVRASEGRTLHGFLYLYDEKKGIAIVTSFCLHYVYAMDTCNPLDLPGGTLDNDLFAFGRAIDGTLMGASCSHPVFKDKGISTVNCEITESGHGGPLLYLPPGGSGHIVGLTVKSGHGKITFLPTKQLHNWLQRFLKKTRKNSHFRGYSLPKGVKTVIPSGFMVRSKVLQSLGYPLPPPLVFELNGRLTGTFEEYFGQLHYWKGYPFDTTYDNGPNPIWYQLGERVTQEISQSVVSIASFKDNTRCFACTGLLITGKDCPLVLTSASLLRTDDAEGEIDEKLKIEVFLPRNHTVQGILELYHEYYNIAVVRLKSDLTVAICPQDILNVTESRNTKSVGRASIGRSVVAIGRGTKKCHGLLMASMGEVKGKYKAITERKRKRSTGLVKKPDCQDLLLSTCQIKKVGIGGPLIGLDGSFIGMNFYDESGTTPFLPRKEILTVVRQGFNLLERWPVSKPYWFLGGQVHPLDQLVGKVLQ
ncbi:hypothetical protein ACQ4PT_047621 [Festuca glaucescens]